VAEVEKLSAELVRVNEDRSNAVRQLKAAEARSSERSVEARKLRQKVADLETALAMAGGPTTGAAGDLTAASRMVDELTPAAASAAEASSAADRLASALESAVAALSPSSTPGPACLLPADLPARRPLRRVAVRLPAGIVDDTRRAAEHLLRLPGAILLVDGYNVSKAGWPELELGTQRLRLANGLAELRARTGAQVELIFDGAEQRQLMARGIPSNVRVRFSPVGVEADDLVLELVDDLPVSRPVIVVSSDKRVRDGARERGASTLSSQTLLSLLR
jgi:predicted RNA-binding protein with PIN domain